MRVSQIYLTANFCLTHEYSNMMNLKSAAQKQQNLQEIMVYLYSKR